MSSLAPDAKRLKINNGSGVGPDQLRSWVSNAKNSGFSPQMREELLKSQNVNAIHILQFVLEFVFGWSKVEIISEYEDDFFREDGTLVHRTMRDVYRDGLNRNDRGKALAFVTEWLGQDPEVESSDPELPSLARLCAQRIAMDMFDTYMDDLDLNFEDENLDYFKDTLKGDIESQLRRSSVPDYLHTPIIEEIIIFIIVHFLYIDLRSLVLWPAHPESVLKLPVLHFIDDVYGDWRTEVVDSVSDTGRGSLAKVGLLTLSVLNSYKKKLSDMERYGSKSYEHIEVMTTGLFSDHGYGEFKSRHPFAYTVAKAPIAAIVHACLRSRDYYDSECTEELVLEHLIPWIERQDTETRKCDYDLLLLASKKFSPTEMRHPGSFMMDQAGCNAIVRDCFDAFDAQELYESAIMYRDDLCVEMSCREGYCRRLRLNGNFSKEEILSAVLVGKDATLIDLEYCKKIDEECLEAILVHTRSLKTMMLKGTQIGKHSNVIRNANLGRKQKIHFTFEDACKCCGGSTIKELKVS